MNHNDTLYRLIERALVWCLRKLPHVMGLNIIYIEDIEQMEAESGR